MQLAPTPQRPVTGATQMRGFSLIELMVTVGILAILAALAGPSFQPLIDKWRVQQAIDNMKTTIYYARSEGIKRGGGIGIQRNTSGSGCAQVTTKEEWGCGWFVFVDTNDNGTWKAGEEILHTIPPPTNLNIVHSSGGTNIKVDRYGKMSGINAKGFSFVSTSGGSGSLTAQSLCMSSGGRIRIAEEIPCPKK